MRAPDASASQPARGMSRAVLLAVGLTVCAAAACMFSMSARAQPGVAARPSATATPEAGPRWNELSASQRSALQPLERDWSSTSESQKRKWLEIAARYPSLPAPERERISARMTEWTKLSPADRGRARLNFQEAKQINPQERQARWQAYQALTPEQRSQLSARAEPAAGTRPADGVRKAPAAGVPKETTAGKSNIVPNPLLTSPPRAVAPTVVQAQTGATTSLMSRRPTPPVHLQAGMPKIAATPGFVDKSTLLPQRGAQGAATRSVAASSAAKAEPAR